MTEQDFFESILRGYNVVEFGASYCSPCKIVEPALEELEVEFQGRFNLIKIDIEESPKIALKFRVMSIPSVLIFKDGEPVDVMYNSYSKNAYRERILKHFSQ
jgi:thioredoxin 1